MALFHQRAPSIPAHRLGEPGSASRVFVLDQRGE